jgi:EpsI family protein
MNKRMLIISTIIFIFILSLKIFPFHETVPLKKPFTTFPLHWKGWIGEFYNLDDKTLDMLKMSEYVNITYKKGPYSMALYIGYYNSQRGGAQIHSPKLCLPASGWYKISENIKIKHIDGLGKINFVEGIYQKDNRKEVFFYWYKMKNVYITNEYKLRFYRFLNSIRYGRNDAAFIRISAPITYNVRETTDLIEDFMKDFLPLLKDYLPE